MKFTIGVLIIPQLLFSCMGGYNSSSNRVLISKSEIDQSSIWDSNGDGEPDVERWFRGSGIVYEKLDNDYDGYWDVQGRRNNSGSFDVYISFPKRKYNVHTNHIFYATNGHPVDVYIMAGNN